METNCWCFYCGQPALMLFSSTECSTPKCHNYKHSNTVRNPTNRLYKKGDMIEML